MVLPNQPECGLTGDVIKTKQLGAKTFVVEGVIYCLRSDCPGGENVPCAIRRKIHVVGQTSARQARIVADTHAQRIVQGAVTQAQENCLEEQGRVN